jgi:hypothetical protein
LRRGTSKVLVGVALALLLFDSAGLYVFFFPPASTYACGQPASTAICGPSSSSVTSSNGLQLTLTINSTVIAAGQEPSIVVSILNTLPVVNNLSTSNDWRFSGVPISMWPMCYWGYPAVIVVLKGNYSLQDLPNVASVSFTYMCAEGVTVDHAIFQPSSDQADITGVYDVTSSRETLGPFSMELNFTTGGYWDLQALAKTLNPPSLGMGSNPPAYVRFVSGVYTIGVADEWSQAVVVHFTVISG